MRRLFILGVMCLTLSGLNAQAGTERGWSWNLGYNNPPSAVLGVNLLYLGDNFGFEVGAGGIQSKETKNNGERKDTISINGAASLKYLFRQGKTFRPYLQAGTRSGISLSNTEDDTSAGAGLNGGGFMGLGFFLIGNPFYVYASYNNGNGNFAQFGAGFAF